MFHPTPALTSTRLRVSSTHSTHTHTHHSYPHRTGAHRTGVLCIRRGQPGDRTKSHCEDTFSLWSFQSLPNIVAQAVPIVVHRTMRHLASHDTRCCTPTRARGNGVDFYRRVNRHSPPNRSSPFNPHLLSFPFIPITTRPPSHTHPIVSVAGDLLRRASPPRPRRRVGGQSPRGPQGDVRQL